MRPAIESVLAQTYGDLELLISDNCSTDDTAEICRSYVRDDSRVVYTRTDVNVGAAANFSRLAHLARGTYFKWICHDDSMAPRFVEECLPIADSDPDIITVAPTVDVVDETGQVLQHVSTYVTPEPWPADRLGQYRCMMDELAYCETHSDGLTMVRYQYGFHQLSLLRRTRLLMPFISADYVLAAELALFGRIASIDAPLSRFTLGGGTSSNYVSWNPVAIQRMLAPTRTGRLDMMWSVRRRHFENVRAVVRSPLSLAQKAAAIEASTRPARRRLSARIARRLDHRG
jgi:glycosyltransferase involved in cell wall biosynthesis